MFGSAVAEVALGLIVTYTAFGGACSALREILARLTSAREELLAAAVYRLLGVRPPEGKARRAYTDLETLSTLEGVTDVGQRATALGKHNLAALVMGHPLVRNLAKDAKSAPAYLPARSFALALLDVLVPDRTARTVRSVRDVVDELEPTSVRNALLPLVDSAGDDLGKLQASLEHHFDDAMDRASGWYKRHTEVVIFAIACALTLAANVDSIHLASALWQNPTERQQLVAQAATAVHDATGSALPSVQTLQMELPLGWHGLPSAPLDWILRVIGWLTSAVAMTMGGPFWFDLLSRFVNLRAAGPSPARAVPQ